MKLRARDIRRIRRAQQRPIPTIPPRRVFDHDSGEWRWRAWFAMTIPAGRGARREARRTGERRGCEVAVVSHRGREVFRYKPTWQALSSGAFSSEY